MEIATDTIDMPKPFLVSTPLVSLGVTVWNQTVTHIGLMEPASRPPQTRFEGRVEEQLLEYFSRSRTAFAIQLAPRGTSFQQAVWRQLCEIPYGETRTYGEVAAAVTNRAAARAVGMANHRNPIPIVIPCHRVIAAGGRLGGYGGGRKLKQKLLQLEANQSLFDGFPR